MAKINFGLRLPAVQPTDVGSLLDFVIEAERLGFHSIWVGDHVFYHVDVLQPLHLLTWVAAQTSRVRLGTAVMLSAYLNPVLLAKAAATIDCLSGGRLSLGVSIGGSEAEFRSIGVPINQRVGRLLENVEIMRRLWREDNVEYRGHYHQIEGGTIKPKPLQAGGPPVYFGATSEAMLKRLVRHADGWVGSGGGTPESYIENAGKVLTFAAERGKDIAGLAFAKLQNISIDPDPKIAQADAEAHWKAYYGPNFNVERGVIIGTPEHCEERLRVFTQAPVPHVTLALELPGLNPARLQLLAQIASRFD